MAYKGVSLVRLKKLRDSGVQSASFTEEGAILTVEFFPPSHRLIPEITPPSKDPNKLTEEERMEIEQQRRQLLYRSS